VEKYHKENIPGSPQEVYETLKMTRDRLNEASQEHGDYISPFDLAG
jgi:aminoglycoside phosphotransferase